jgi:hypothetical protein
VKLDKDEFVVTAWAEACNGPGWANAPVKVLVQDGNGKLRVEYLQPDELNQEVNTLYGVSNLVSYEMTKAVSALVKAKPRRIKHEG